MRHTLLLLLLVACTDDVLSVDEWNGEADDAEATTNSQPTHGLEDCPGNAPGGPVESPIKRPIPPERDCTKEPDAETCKLCCDWNADRVWGERCRRIKDERKRNACWWDLENKKRPECQRACPRTAFTGDLP